MARGMQKCKHIYSDCDSQKCDNLTQKHAHQEKARIGTGQSRFTVRFQPLRMTEKGGVAIVRHQAFRAQSEARHSPGGWRSTI